MVRLTIRDRDQYRIFDQLGMPIIDVGDNYVKALATAEQLARVKSLGFPVEVLLKDYTREFEELGYGPMGEGPAWGFYHTYPQVRDSLKALAQRHPDICQLESLGLSVQGRALWGIRISGNVGVRENEPRFRIVGNIHGNEQIGCEVALYLAYLFADSFGVSSRISDLVNSREVFVVPMQNPDGAVANTRSNANGVNLNRDYGYMWEGWEGSADFYSQPETRLIRQDEETHEYTMSLDYHSGAVYVCMPWGYSGVYPPDETLFKRLAWGFHTFSGYDTITNFRWYQVCGVSHDASYGTHGTLGLISEVWLSGSSTNPPPESIEYVCRRNKDAVLYLLARSGIGVRGVVSDAANGSPVQARVQVKPRSRNQDWFLYSSRDNGDFHRPLLAGTYELHFSAPGYRDTTVAGVVVPDTITPVEVNASLTPAATAGAFRVIAVQQNDTTGRVNPTLTHWALGRPDSMAYSMSFGGRIVLDMGEAGEIADGPGPDVRVVEYPHSPDTIRVYGSAAWKGPWTLIGTGIGACSLDLTGSGINRARYVRINDAGHHSNNYPYAGYDLDAVVALNTATVVREAPGKGSLPDLNLTVSPNPLTSATTIRFSLAEPGPCRLSLYDVSGRLAATLDCGRRAAGPASLVLRPASGGLAGGVYVLRLEAQGRQLSRKLIFKE
jgi:hypothetical protein